MRKMRVITYVLLHYTGYFSDVVMSTSKPRHLRERKKSSSKRNDEMATIKRRTLGFVYDLSDFYYRVFSLKKRIFLSPRRRRHPLLDHAHSVKFLRDDPIT
jgi:hypothetical protein